MEDNIKTPEVSENDEKSAENENKSNNENKQNSSSNSVNQELLLGELKKYIDLKFSELQARTKEADDITEKIEVKEVCEW